MEWGADGMGWGAERAARTNGTRGSLRLGQNWEVATWENAFGIVPNIQIYIIAG